jgi:hypothetical protein
MNKSIAGMNWTTGNRELDSIPLTTLERLKVKLELAYTLQAVGQCQKNRLLGNKMEEEVLHELSEYVTADPAHIQTEAQRQAAEIAVDAEWLAEATAEHADWLEDHLPHLVNGVSSLEWWDAQEERPL